MSKLTENHEKGEEKKVGHSHDNIYLIHYHYEFRYYLLKNQIFP